MTDFKLSDWTRYRDEVNLSLAKGIAVSIDKQVRVVVKPKPRYMPLWMYRRILKMTVYLEVDS